MEPIKILLIGCGRWGSRLLAKLETMPELFRVSDACDSSPLLRHSPDFNHPIMLHVRDDSVIPDVDCDAVFIASPNDTHAGYAIQALQAGKHVFIEKPMATTTPDAEAIAEEARKRPGQVCFVGHVTHYDDGMKEFIRLAKMQGEPGLTFCREGCLATRDQPEQVWWDMAPHDVASMLEVYGLDVPVCASGVVFDMGITMLDIGDATFLVSRRDTAKPERWCRYTTWQHSVEYWSDKRILVGVDGRQKKFTNDPLEAELREFAACCREGRQPPTGVEQGLATVRVLAMAAEKIREAVREKDFAR